MEWVAISFSNAWKWKVKSESEVAQSCPTLSDPMDGSLRGSPVPGILQGRALEWVPSPPPNCECSHLHILQIYVWFIFRWLLECIVCWSVSAMINKLSLYSLLSNNSKDNNNNHLLGDYYHGLFSSSSCVLNHLVLRKTFWDQYFYPHFIIEESETQERFSNLSQVYCIRLGPARRQILHNSLTWRSLM